MNLKKPEQPFYWWPRTIHASHIYGQDWRLWLWFKWWVR